MNSTRKGKQGERQAAAYLRSLGFTARRGQQHAGGPDSPDIVTDIPGWHFEVKYGSRSYINFGATLDKALAQATREAPPGAQPAVLWYQTGGLKRWVLTTGPEAHYIGHDAIGARLRATPAPPASSPVHLPSRR